MVGDTVGAAGSHYAESSPHIAFSVYGPVWEYIRTREQHFQCMGPRENVYVPGNSIFSVWVRVRIYTYQGTAFSVYGSVWECIRTREQHFQCMGPCENIYVPGRINKEVSASVLSWIFLLTALISQIHGDCWIPAHYYWTWMYGLRASRWAF